ncbi:hypothetical protein HK413_08485 [Mucilaginibacter sp. S1162]|uniref:Uncharacterized protein n=1 Tax=Mucilaginibacter humi TaxID=2732510 RepID=A0ABX1W3I5_9SPHI|nr:hypothetical protein [Mucilaginibacter humi]NNU34173.1 hypothetical protein [Mucilaginibacter humi]
MKKHTVPNEPEEMPVEPDRPEIKQPVNPEQPELPQREIPGVPQEMPPPTVEPGQPKVI